MELIWWITLSCSIRQGLSIFNTNRIGAVVFISLVIIMSVLPLRGDKTEIGNTKIEVKCHLVLGELLGLTLDSCLRMRSCLDLVQVVTA